jgi:hypothetical protein
MSVGENRIQEYYAIRYIKVNQYLEHNNEIAQDWREINWRENKNNSEILRGENKAIYQHTSRCCVNCFFLCYE